MIEKELRGFIKKEEFQNCLATFTELFGTASYSKRLSLALANYDNLTLETKIRITNAEAEVVQKVGDFTAVDREEITIKLPRVQEGDLFNLYKTYKNFLKDTANPMLTMIQHENYVFANANFEVKLFRQFGNDEFFAFEVEALVDMADAELEDFCEEHGLKVDVNYNDLASIQARNTKVNVDLENLDDASLLLILKEYLAN